MDENYKNIMRQNLKKMGMPDAQIEAAVAMQEASMQNYANENMSDMLSDAAKDFLGLSSNDIFADLMDDSGSCFEFSKNPTINKSYQWAIACSADLIHWRGDKINDLTTGVDSETCDHILFKQWNITTLNEFFDMAEFLKNAHQSSIFHKLAEGEICADYNLSKAMDIFRSNGETSTIPNMLIWDLERLVHISRLAFDARLIDRQTALYYIKDVALQVKKNYKSWKELSIGYRFGCVVCNGSAEYEILKEGMELLLTETDSPWVTLPFDMSLNFEENESQK